jgi:BioD-like phosphotransacetylase family protein
VKTIYLASVTPFVGKNVVCLGLAMCLQQMGRKVGFFKPFGPLVTEHEGVVTDSDAVFFRRVLNLPDRLEDICPLVITDEAVAEVLRGADLRARERIMRSYETVARGKDVVLCTGMGRLSAGLAAGFPSLEFVRLSQAGAVVLDRYRYPFESLDGILHMRESLGERLAGVVFNRIQETVYSQVSTAVRSHLASQGVAVFGVLPEDSCLGSVPVRDLVQALNGRLLCGGGQVDRLVEGFSIGAMNVDSAIRFFRRTPKRAVVTGGDRPDIQLAALEAGAKCLVLTGNLYPNERILTRAEDLQVPVILVAADTSTTIAVCEELAGQVTLNSEQKLGRVREICDENLDYDALFRKTGVLA